MVWLGTILCPACIFKQRASGSASWLTASVYFVHLSRQSAENIPHLTFWKTWQLCISSIHIYNSFKISHKWESSFTVNFCLPDTGCTKTCKDACVTRTVFCKLNILLCVFCKLSSLGEYGRDHGWNWIKYVLSGKIQRQF